MSIIKNKIGYFYASLCILAWSFIPVVSKFGQITLNFFQLLFWSNIISTICLGFIFYLSSSWKTNYVSIAHILYNLFLGSLGCALYYLFLYYGYYNGNSIEVLIIQYSWPLQMILLASVILNEKLSISKIIAVILGFFGIIIIVTKGNLQEINFSGIVTGLTVLLGAFCFALFSTLSKRSKVELFYFSFLIFLGGTITSTFALLAFTTFQIPSSEEILPILINGIFINGISYIFWIKAIKSISITNSAVLVFLTPLFSLIWIVIFFNEKFYLSYILGGTIVIISGIYCLKEKNY